MAISDGLTNDNVPTGGVGSGVIQQTAGMGTERQDARPLQDTAKYSRMEGGHNGSGRVEGGSQLVAGSPATRKVYGGARSEIWFPPTQIKKMLGDHLRSATRPCKICFHELLKDAPNPGLVVKGSGPIAFPFLQRDIDLIIQASKRLNVEEESQDVSSTRTTWEIPSGMLELNNPSWGRLVATVLSKIGSGLDIEQTGRGILATEPILILHEPGSVVDTTKW